LFHRAGTISPAENSFSNNKLLPVYRGFLCPARISATVAGQSHVLRCTPGGWAGFSGTGKILAMVSQARSCLKSKIEPLIIEYLKVLLWGGTNKNDKKRGYPDF
jgi:hypothetical protein